jgi:nicotinate-nucleotide pyrophosphorylase (carboxylating)
MVVNTLPLEILSCIRRALDEDIGSGDATTNAILHSDATLTGRIRTKQAGVVAGLNVARATFNLLDERVNFDEHVADGSQVETGQTLASVSGLARPILTAERTALNFLGRMSGVATLTRRFVEAVSGTNAIILDTRKTAPGLRAVDKQAVLLGGGQNHRIGLYDMILIKDNHIDFARSLAEAVHRARAAETGLEIEVEARSLEDVQSALDLGIHRILLDNMPPDMMHQAVQMSAGRALLEASGNVSLENIQQIAESGVDYISIGALTHSVRALDVSLLLDKETITISR